MAAPAVAQDAPRPAPNACFSVVEGRQDVPPGAPMLVDRCTGDTFVLSRAKSRTGGYEWTPLAKGTVRTDAAPIASAGKSAAAKSNCFSYNGRTYCP